MGILDKITSPEEIKKLNINELNALAEELRGEIIEVISKNGGHLASNLGIIETTIALYNHFDFKSDKLIFDVGHQCYAHKILSDRRERFSSIRTDGGISGFPDREESLYDAFGVGHAGTSISAGLGCCYARDIKGEDDYVIVVVGDGSLVNGLNLEAMTSSNTKPKKFIVILNDNGMSISKNKNGFYNYISKKTAKRGYVKSKRGFLKVFGKKSFITSVVGGVKDFLESILKKKNYFESYGFKYVGVVDGNNLKELNNIFDDVKYLASERAVFLHIKTTKGKGHTEAEEHADLYHGVGENLVNERGDLSLALGNKICSLIEENKNIIAITAGMKDGTGLKIVEEKFPDNFYDVGIAEEFAVTLSAGMAVGGVKPIVCMYSTFLQRAYDQVLPDVCLQNLPVIFCIDRAWFVGNDGKTHQGVFDLSYLSHIPNLTILAPTTVDDLSKCLDYALLLNSPCAIRYPKNALEERQTENLTTSLWERVKVGNKVSLLAVGPRMLDLAKKVSDSNSDIGVISARSIKPLDEKILNEIKDTFIITLEENSLIGGFGSLVQNYYLDKNIAVKIKCMGIKDEFINHGSVAIQLKQNGFTRENLLDIIEKG